MITAKTPIFQSSEINQNPNAKGMDSTIAVKADNCLGLKFFGLIISRILSAS